MKPKNYEVLMDIYMGVLNAPAIQFTTEDFGMCQITFSLLEDRITPYNLSNCIVRMVINGQQQDCTISDANNGKAEIVLLQSMFTEVGFVTAELQIYDATNQTMRLTTPTFKYTVRKSLMDDNTVQADANYSILQQMILNVSNADKVSSEALKLSKEAKAICDDLVPKANTAAQNAQTALDRAESVVTQEELAQKVMLDGKDTKFDFIKNGVEKGFTAINSLDVTRISINTDLTIVYDFVLEKKVANDYNLIGKFGTSANYHEYIGFHVPTGHLEFGSGNQTYRKNVLSENRHYIMILTINKDSKEAKLYFEDFIGVRTFTQDMFEFLGVNTANQKPQIKLLNSGYYNRILSIQEIQHTVSVLNNSPAIKELHTTNAEDETSILKLASNTDHVEDRSGRTQEQINRTFYKRMCKEIPSPSGEPITVKNGEEGYVLSAEIKGNTQLFKRAKGSQDEWIVIPNDEGRDTVAFEYKLDSTQAIISNNGEPYPIYANEEDKANKKVISLPFPEDKLILNEDGSATWIDASNRKTLNNNEPWIKSSVQNAEANCFQIEIIDADNNGNSVIVFCDKLESVTGASTLSAGTLKPNTCGIDGSRYLRVGVPKTVDTVEQMKEFAQNLNIIYRSKIQEITHIDKSIVPNILTHKTNILEAGGAVKPSSFKVTVPVDKLAEIEARLQALESTTVDVVLNK